MATIISGCKLWLTQSVFFKNLTYELTDMLGSVHDYEKAEGYISSAEQVTVSTVDWHDNVYKVRFGVANSDVFLLKDINRSVGGGYDRFFCRIN